MNNLPVTGNFLPECIDETKISVEKFRHNKFKATYDTKTQSGAPIHLEVNGSSDQGVRERLKEIYKGLTNAQALNTKVEQ